MIKKIIILLLFITSGFAQNLSLNPMLSQLTHTSVYINWRMDNSGATAIVNYGGVNTTNIKVKTSIGRETIEAITNYNVKLDNLLPNTEYWYQIECGNYISPILYFKTLTQSNTFSFVAYGDNRSNSDMSSSYTLHARNIITLIDSYNPEFIIHTGDIVYRDYRIENWEWYYNDVDNFNFFAQNAVFYAAGNHERIGRNPRYFFDILNQPNNNPEQSETYYSFVVNNCKFICIDGNKAYDSNSDYWVYEYNSNSIQYQWIESELANSINYDFVFVYLHYPFYSTGYHGVQNEYPDLISLYEPLFIQYKVDIVFAGHDHSYERTEKINGVTYIVAGGGGADLYSQSDDDASWSLVYDKSYNFVKIDVNGLIANVTMIREGGNIGDQFSINSDNSLPVNLKTFDVTNDGKNNILNWKTQTELNSYKFIIEKSTDGLKYQSIGEVYSYGNSSIERRYSLTDNNIESYQVYYYRLKEISIDGISSIIGNTSIYVNGEFRLYQNHPNPFNQSTIVKFSLSVPSNINCSVYSIDGKLVKTLARGDFSAGTHELVFNSEKLSSGWYIISLYNKNTKMNKNIKVLSLK